MSREISNREVVAPSGRAPEKRPMQGRLARLQPMDVERHAEGLYIASHDSEEAKQGRTACSSPSATCAPSASAAWPCIRKSFPCTA
jgi:hypothetical protein